MSIADHPEAGTLHDLTDRLVVADCATQFNRADLAGPEALAAWAREWGRPALALLHWAEGRGYVR